MSFDRQPYLDRIRSVPPRCLDGFVCKFDPKPGIEGNGYVYAGWSLTCRCGSARGRLRGYPSRAPGYLAPPLAFECGGCSTRTEVLDSTTHGYGAELSPGGPSPVPTGTETLHACPGCSGTEVAVSCVFIIPAAAFDAVADDVVEETDFGLGERIQDLFDQFSAECTCTACGR